MNTHDTDQTNQVRHKVRKEKKMLNYRYLVRHFYILSPSVRLVFGSTFGVWEEAGFCRLAWLCAWWNTNLWLSKLKFEEYIKPKLIAVTQFK